MSPGTTTTDSTTAQEHDSALLAAWRRFLDYDLASSAQKTLYQRLRRAIILLGLFTSVTAVISLYAASISGLPEILPLIQGGLRLALIIMPIASVALMNYASQFATSTGWVEYRVSAEMIRSQIYLYRLNVPPYAGLDIYQKRAQLLKEVAGIDTWMRKYNLPMPQMQVLTDQQLIERIKGKTEGEADDGFSPLESQQYVGWRVQGQLNWYTGKIEQDYRTMRQNRVAAIVVASFGSVLAGIGGGLEGLVGITTALGVTITTISDVQMYGRTYRLYHETAFDLKNLLNEWKALSPTDRAAQAQVYITRFEEIFDRERRKWREDTIRVQISNEQAIYSQVQQIAGSQADNLLAQNASPSAVPERPSLFTAQTQTTVERQVTVEVSEQRVSETHVELSGEAAADGAAPEPELLPESLAEDLATVIEPEAGHLPGQPAEDEDSAQMSASEDDDQRREV